MDRHDLAHYGLALALFAGGSTAVHHFATQPPVLNVQHARAASAWSPLTDIQRASLTASFKGWSGPREITIYCVNDACDDIADDVAAAASDAGIKVKQERSIMAPDGVSVGGPVNNPDIVNPVSHDLAKLFFEGTAEQLAPGISVEPSPFYFVSFGRKPK